MANEELKLWHWYANPYGDACLLVSLSDGYAFVRGAAPARAAKACLDQWASDCLIGPIAGPGEPPEAPKNRKDAERMAREWAPVTSFDDWYDSPSADAEDERALARAAWHKAANLVNDRSIRDAIRLERERDEWKRRAEVETALRLEAQQENTRIAAEFRSMGEQVAKLEDAAPQGDKALWEAMTHAGREGVIKRAKHRRTRWLLGRVRAAGEWMGKRDIAVRITGHVEQDIRTLDPDAPRDVDNGAPDEPPAGHVRVRIPVEVTATGAVSTEKHAWVSSEDALAEMRETAKRGSRISVIEADVPLPSEPETVRGRVAD